MEKLDKKNIEEILELTPMQQGMLFHYLKNPGGGHYFEQLSLEISGEIDRVVFKKAWDVVIRNNEMLRTVFRWEKLEKPAQIILKEHKCGPAIYDLAAQDISLKYRTLEELKLKDREDAFDLYRVPFRVILCKLDQKKYEVVISNHHILYDGWSNGTILKEFFQAYHELCNGGQSIKSSVKSSFKEFIKWVQNQDRVKQEQFWRDYLDGFDTPTVLPAKRRRDEAGGVENVSLMMGDHITDKLDVFISHNRVTMASVLYTAWGILLQKYCSSDDVIFGTLVSGRSARIKGIEDMVGLFINTVPLRARAYPKEKMGTLLLRIDRQLQQREEFEHTPLVDLRNYSTVEGGRSLFDTIVALENYPLDNHLVPGDSLLSVLSYSLPEVTHYDLTVSIIPFHEIEVKFTYKRELFDREIIENMALHFRGIVRNIIENPEQEVSRLDILTREEKNRLLDDFNNTGTGYPHRKTIHQLFAEQVEGKPDRIALVGGRAEGGEDSRETVGSENVSLTYRELNENAHGLACLLREKRIGPDTLVGILVERSLEMVVGILGILKSGAAYLPIDPDYPEARKGYMLKESNVRHLLTLPAVKVKAGAEVREDPGEVVDIIDLSRLGVFSSQSLIANPGFPSRCTFTPVSRVNPANLAYVIYTSGSTGRPKGILVEHRSLVNLCCWHNRYYGVGEKDNAAQYAGFGFDAAVWEIFPYLIKGAALHVIPQRIKHDIEFLGNYYNTFHITIGFLPTQFCQQFIERWRELRTLRALLTGGDKLHRFMKTNYRLYNNYGPTENTVVATVFPVEASWENIPIGTPVDNTRLYIFSRDNMHLQPVGVPGELCIGGDNLARGYSNRPELTCERFINYKLQNTKYKQKNSEKLLRGVQGGGFLEKSPPGRRRQRLYKTGDLAQWLPDGNIQFLGRLDQQVKIRGFRIELGEIERQLLKHEQVKDAVVVAREDKPGDKSLAAYIVSTRELPGMELKKFLSRELPGYMIPSSFTRLALIPLTLTGKIHRGALPEPAITPVKGYIAPGNDRERALVELWARALEIDAARIGIDDDFFELGGHSLKATLLAAKIHKAFDVHVPVPEIFTSPTIRGLARYIEEAVLDKYISIEPVEKKEYYALSSAQKRLYVLQQMDHQGTGYNIPSVWDVEGDIDEVKFRAIFHGLCRRHESLRTSFHLVQEEPAQQIHRENYNIQISYCRQIPGSPSSIANFIKNFVHPFDLSQAPLFRAGVIKIEARKHLLMVDMHHIIADGMSMQILMKDFSLLYSGRKLPEAKLQYRDYAGWQNCAKERGKIREQEQYWKREFEDEIPVLELPLDFPRPTSRGFEGSSLDFEIDSTEVDALKALVLENGATLYMGLFALYVIFLAKTCSQEDIVVGTPVAGRRHADLESITGMFVNTLALRNHPSGEKTPGGFLQEVKAKTLKAFENQEYQYEDLVEQAAVSRAINRNPLFDTMFVLQNSGPLDLDLPGLKLSPYKYENKTSKFDLTLTGVEVEDKLKFTFEYDINLFRETTIERFTGYFKKIVSSIACPVKEDRKIREIEIMPDEEKNRLLVEFNNSEAGYPGDKTLHRLFAEQVEKNPDSIGVSGHSVPYRQYLQLSYREIDRSSAGVAYLLGQKGVEADTIAGIMVERSPEMIIGIMGILKAGGAYLPLDPAYPRERIQYILEDSAAKMLLIDDESQGRGLPSLSTLNLSLSKQVSAASPVLAAPTPAPRGNPVNLAYIIYTSGSTGIPKGVMVQHGPVVNVLSALQQRYPLEKTDTYLLKTSYLFDVSVTELFGWYLGGGRVITLEIDSHRDPQAIVDSLERHNVSHVNFVPSMFSAFLECIAGEKKSRISGLKYIFLAGEALLAELVEKFNRIETNVVLENLYGPTESTVYSSLYSLSAWSGSGIIPIGKPLPNIKLYILNKYNRLQPLGVAGELCIGGSGLARGYLNRPELSGEKFSRGLLTEEQRLYHTGDQVRWRWDGQVEFLGRIDQQVKVRGFRIELGEIENRILRHEAIREAVVVGKEDGAGDKILAAYFVPGREISVPGLREYLLTFLPGYMIPACFIRLDAIPRTAAGKIDQRALPSPGIEGMGTYAAPRNSTEEKLVELWNDILGGKDRQSPTAKTIGTDDNFFHLGGHSLKAVVMVSKIHKTFGVKLTVQDLFRFPTIAGLAGLIGSSAVTDFEEIETLPEQPYYEMSYAQKRLWLLNKMEPQSTAFNFPVKITLYEAVDESIIREILAQWLTRHNSFRTFFKNLPKDPVQVIEPIGQLESNLEVTDWSLLEEKERKSRRLGVFTEESSQVFNLAEWPLFRARLIKYGPEEYDFVLNMHHIVTDGWSVDILRQEFLRLYDAYKSGIPCDLEPLRIQYKDYAAWQNRLLADEKKVGRANGFWMNYLGGVLPVLDLPYDFSPGPGGLDKKKSSAYCFVIERETVERLHSFAREQKASLFIVLLASFNILLSHITGQEEILMAVPAAARQHWELKSIVGMFVNTLLLRSRVNMEDTYIDLLRSVQTDTFNALEYQAYPLELIFSELKMKYPEISVFFNMVNVGISQEEQLTDLNSYHMEETQETKFELVCYLTEFKNGLQVSCHYFRELFLPETIEKMMRLFTRMLELISKDPGKKIRDYCMAKKKKNILQGLKTRLGGLGEKEEKVNKEPDIRKNVREVQQRLSTLNSDFLDYVERNPGCIKPSNFQTLDLNDDLFRLQPWPTFINRESRLRFQEVGVKLFNLVKQIPTKVFGRDLHKMSRYYKTPVEVLNMQLEGVTAEHVDNLLSRGDFMISSSGLKCLEYNVTPSLGGWQVPIWESLYLKTPILAQFFKEYAVKTKNKNLLGLFLEHVIRCSLGKLSAHESELNIALAIKGYEEGMGQENWMHSTGGYLNLLYKDLLPQVNPSLKGELLLCNYQQLDLLDNCIFYKGKKIHGLTEAYNGMVTLEVMKAFKAGNLSLFNGPITHLLSNKLNLAVLSDPETNAVFTDEEREIIAAHVPWTRKTSPGPTTYQGDTIADLEHFMLSHQERLVLKPSGGYGGKGIQVGNKTPREQWQEGVKSALHEKDWVVQEWVDASPGLYQVGDGCDDHDMAWGFFIFGSQYTGAWVRVMPRMNNKGVINCHQGATVSVIFEVDE